MLPSPGFIALVALEGVEGDDEHALGAFGPEPKVDVVERTCRGWDAQRSRNAACQAVEIIVGAKRLRPVRNGSGRGAVKIDQVKIGRVGQRATAKPAEAQDDQLALVEPAVRFLELAHSGISQRN